MLSGEAIPVTFRFEKHILNDVMDWFGSIRLFNEQEDTIDAQVTVNREAMICWAMQYGRYVEVLGPGDLREEESTHFRLLYKLLNPEGSHGCGDAFLQKFFEDVLDKPYEKTTGVCREENTKDGRMGLLIEGESFYYPIEVKIDAGDQYRQIERYTNFAERQRKGRNNVDTMVYYLTLDRHRPSKECLGEIRQEQVKYISFADEIAKWLMGCFGFIKERMEGL